jgi:hypothetical protein
LVSAHIAICSGCCLHSEKLKKLASEVLCTTDPASAGSNRKRQKSPRWIQGFGLAGGGRVGSSVS